MLFFHGMEDQPMLMLTRKVGEKIRIDSNIVLVVVEVEGYGVRLGIEAPPDVPIRPAELPAFCHDKVADLVRFEPRLPHQE
jgi:carbon storage regulator CsrA